MSLNYDYGINVGNRFGGFVDHEEDPEEFLAQQTRTEEKTKKSKDTKTTTATSSSTTTTGANTKSNKENVTGKSTTSEQRKQGSVAFSDNQQQSRPESGRGQRVSFRVVLNL